MNKKAFTLIELMIVVVILWVLMATVLPKLTWGQAKARDVARTADLTAISQALEMFTSDNNQFPEAYWCLASWATADQTFQDIKRYLKNGQVPTDPVPTAKIWTSSLVYCGSWYYFYSALNNNWFDNAWYILCADVENYANWNFLATDLPTDKNLSSDTVSKLWEKVDTPTSTDDTANPNNTIYCVIR